MQKKDSNQLSRNKIISCPICLSVESKKYWAMPGYLLHECAHCGLVWDPFPPDNETEQYDHTYFQNDNPKGGYTNYFEGMRINKRTFSDRLKKIEKKAGKGLLLDVGSALGDCVEEAKKMGWKNPQGLEVSEFAVKEARKKGLNIMQGTLESAKLPENKYDVVLYQDVIEHIKDPLKELKMVRKVLKSGGIVFLVTPDVGGLWNKILKSWWYHYKPREHIIYFSERSIRFALRESGYKNITTKKTYHVLSLEYVLMRLKYYQPFVFDFLLKMSKFLRINEYSFKAYTGELEAWGEK